MNIQIHARNIELNERLSNYIQQKLSRLDHYLPNVTDVHVDLAYGHSRSTGDRAIAQLTIRNSRGVVLRAEEKERPDLFAAVDAALDKLYRQISRYKDKQHRHAGHDFDQLEPDLAAAEPLPSDNDYEAESNEVVVRRKSVSITTMTEQEAIDQMELLGHTFFIFLNPDDGVVNVLYKRHDGNYGLLMPQIE